MIEHAPEVREKLQDLGIAVLEDYSSYEAHPLGRCEWIEVYGALLGKSEEAEALFAAQKKYLDAVAEMEETGKRLAAFFYINSAGQAVCRSSSDYVSKMIALAGGESVFRSLENDGSARSTVTMEMEKFYEEARGMRMWSFTTARWAAMCKRWKSCWEKLHCWRISRQCAVVTCGVPATIFIRKPCVWEK